MNLCNMKFSLVTLLLLLTTKVSIGRDGDDDSPDEADPVEGGGIVGTFTRALVQTLAVTAPLMDGFVRTVSAKSTATDLVPARNGAPGLSQPIERMAPFHASAEGMGKKQAQMANWRPVDDAQKKHRRVVSSRVGGGAGDAFPAAGRLLTELPALSGDFAVHDPSMVQLSNGLFVLYSTHNGMEERQSTDLAHWYRASKNSAAFPTGLAWANILTKDPNEFWAPDVSGPHGIGKKKKYWLFYAVPFDGAKLTPPRKATHTAAIGRAISRTGLPGTWRDLGRILSSNERDNFNAIDPNLFVDSNTNRWWLQFGSYLGGIQQLELDPRTGALLHSDRTPQVIAARPDVEDHAIEAPFLFRKGKWHFLFVSFGHCCQGTASTYSIHVGRSDSANGPFRDRRGILMTAGGGTLLLGTNGPEVGPGGQSVVTTDDKRDILLYHYYDANADGRNTLGLRQIRWDAERWPTV